MGCGRVDEVKTEAPDNTIINNSQGEAVAAFNDQLKNLDNTAEARAMLGGIISAVAVSFQDDSGSISSLAAERQLDAVLDKLAVREIAGRKPGAKAFAEGSAEAALITPDKIAQSINKLSPEPAPTGDIVEKVKETQQALRELVPNISADQGEGMTPIEATLVSYALYAAGSGGASPESISLDIPKGKAAQFFNEIAE